MTTPPTSAYQQVTQWDQQWHNMEMAKPITPLDDTDASNEAVEDPNAQGGFALPKVPDVNLPKVAPADSDADLGRSSTDDSGTGEQGLNVFA